MGFLIYRSEKVKTAGEIGGREAEMNRTKADVGRFQNSDIDWELTDKNIDFKITHDWEAAVKAKCEELGCPIKKDSVLVLDHLITASPEWMQAQDEETKMRFFEDAKQWIIDEFCGGDESLLLSCRVHRDEKTDHLCASTIPIMKNAQRSEEELAQMKRKPRQKDYSLNAKKIMGSRAEYSARQQRIEDSIGKKYGLQGREVREQGQAKKHRSVEQCKLNAVREEVQAEEKKLAETRQQAAEARKQAESEKRKQQAELGILQAKTKSELHKQRKALRQEVHEAPKTNIFGKRKVERCPGGDYYDVSRSEFDRLEGKVEDMRQGIDDVRVADYAGKEAVEQLQDLLADEQAFIRKEAARIAEGLLAMDLKRIKDNKAKQQELEARAAALSLKEKSLAEREQSFQDAVAKGVEDVLKQLDLPARTLDRSWAAYMQRNYPEIFAKVSAEYSELQMLRRIEAKDAVKRVVKEVVKDDRER